MTPETAVALGTGALAIATFWLAWEAHKHRNEEKTEVVRRILRAALAEQLDNCRAWVSRDPIRGEASILALHRAEPRLEATTEVLESLDLPPDVAAYLVWHVGQVREDWHQVWLHLDRLISYPTDQGVFDSEGRPGWILMVDRLQVLAALLAGEARRRDLPEIAAPYQAAPWVVVQPGPDRERELRFLDDRTRRGAPPWPADPAYVFAEPTARDRAGGVTGAAQRAFLDEPSEDLRRRLRPGG